MDSYPLSPFLRASVITCSRGIPFIIGWVSFLRRVFPRPPVIWRRLLYLQPINPPIAPPLFPFFPPSLDVRLFSATPIFFPQLRVDLFFHPQALSLTCINTLVLTVGCGLFPAHIPMTSPVYKNSYRSSLRALLVNVCSPSRS